MSYFPAVDQYAFLRRNGAKLPHFAQKIQGLRPFVKIRMAGIDVYQVPFEHLIDFEYTCGEGDFGVDGVNISFYDQSLVFIETLIRLGWTENTGKEVPFAVSFGWWSSEKGYYESPTMHFIILNLTYNFGTAGPVINIGGPAVAFKTLGFKTVNGKKAKFKANTPIKKITITDADKNKKQVYDFTQNQGIELIRQNLVQFIRDHSDDSTIANKTDEQLLDVQVLADLNSQGLTELIDEGVDFTGAETLEEAIQKIVANLATSQEGDVKIYVSSNQEIINDQQTDGSQKPKALNTLYIIDTHKYMNETAVSLDNSDLTKNSPIIDIYYPSNESSVINFTPTFNAWITWLNSARKIVFDNSGLPKEISSGNPQAIVLGKPNASSGKDNTVALEQMSKQEAEAYIKKVNARREIIAATATLEILGEPLLVGASNLFNTALDIHINTAQLNYVMADRLFFYNFNQLDDTQRARMGGDKLGTPVSTSPFNGRWIITSFKHNIGNGSFKTTLQLFKVS